MRIRVLGAGFYGCHIAASLLADGHEVEVWDIADHIFAGASGAIPARLHLGFHYPRSRLTRAACQDHSERFMAEYGGLTSGVPINLYAIASAYSLVDFDQYLATLRGEVDFVPVHDPREFGLRGVEGAVLTGERHIVTRLARTHFERVLAGRVHFEARAHDLDSHQWDWTVDCTFGANSDAGVDRYEPCLVVILSGPVDRAVTIMDGPFGSIYPWDEELGLCSLSSARWTPFDKSIKRYSLARAVLDKLGRTDIEERGEEMIDQMADFYPAIRDFTVEDYRLSIRAMPLSGADTRLVDVAHAGPRSVRVRAGKIDAIFAADEAVRRLCGIRPCSA